MDYLYHYDSPLGGITLSSDGSALTGLWFDGQKYFGSTLSKNSGCQIPSNSSLPVFEQACRWLTEYFSGKNPGFTPPLSVKTTPFRRAVWEILLAVPYGQTMTYGEIAAKIAGQKGLASMSAQAVGGAVGHNPISLIIPCHRIVGTDGSLTGYAAGLNKKEKLLAMEQGLIKDLSDFGRKEGRRRTLKDKPIEESIVELMTTCGFGTVVLPVSPVSGGLMHRMYKVTTDCGVYAVKHLNPEIMRRPNVRDNYDRAEKIESLLEKKGIPIVPSLSVDGRKMQNVEGNRFYIFNWQEGRITDWNHISNDQCKAAGSILGRIHAIQPENIPRKEPALCEINWNGYVRGAKEQKSEIAPLLADNVRLLTYAVRELNRARASLPAISCVSNEDMDPKNVMWDNGRPWVIDLECLDYGNPVSHALQLALQWSGIVTCHMDPEKMLAFFHGYLDAYDNGFRSYSDVFGLAYTWVEWLEYNIQRALGACGDQTEQALGISEVRNTIERIRYIRSMEEEIRDVLDSRLP